MLASRFVHVESQRVREPEHYRDNRWSAARTGDKLA